MVDWNALVNGPVMDQFGAPHQYKPRAGQPYPITGTFHDAYNSVDVSDGIPITTSGPAVGINLQDFQNPPVQGDKIDITQSALYEGGVHSVKEVRPNGVGAVLLLLNFTG